MDVLGESGSFNILVDRAYSVVAPRINALTLSPEEVTQKRSTCVKKD